MQTEAALLVLLLWSNLANNQIFAAEDESQISTPLQNQSLVLHNSKDFLPFIDGDALEGENSLELLNDSYSSDELVTSSSSEFSDNLKDILREDSEDEGKEGSTYAMEDNIYDDNYDYDYSEEDEEYTTSEQESDLNDKESDQESESDFDMTTNENMSTISAEVNVLTAEGKSSDEEISETSTNRSIMIEPEDSLVETSLVSETSLVESSLVRSLWWRQVWWRSLWWIASMLLPPPPLQTYLTPYPAPAQELQAPSRSFSSLILRLSLSDITILENQCHHHPYIPKSL